MHLDTGEDGVVLVILAARVTLGEPVIPGAVGIPEALAILGVDLATGMIWTIVATMFKTNVKTAATTLRIIARTGGTTLKTIVKIGETIEVSEGIMET